MKVGVASSRTKDAVCRGAGVRDARRLLQVDCRTRLGDDWSGPSERLARMMEKQDGKLVQRLKGYIEASSHAVSVC